MKNRFNRRKTGQLSLFVHSLPLIIFLVIFCFFIFGVNSISNTTRTKQQENLETALSRSITQCYAVEGMYPPDLDYLKNHYGLSYDEDTFFVNYQLTSSNIAPEVTVSLHSSTQE